MTNFLVEGAFNRYAPLALCIYEVRQYIQGTYRQYWIANNTYMIYMNILASQYRYE